MSGHSKWSTIKRQKAVTDAKRSAVFTKLGRLIAIAAREGGKDPAMNFKLRLAIDKAKAANMPNNNIERAISTGAGEGKGEQMKEVVYEGFGPGGAAVMVQAATDNSNRTAAEIRSTFQKHNGRLGGQNSVAWMFDVRGLVHIPADEVKKQSAEEFELGLIDAGADDVSRQTEGSIDVAIKPEHLKTFEQWLKTHGVNTFESDTTMLPKNRTELSDLEREQLYGLMEALDDLPDVTGVFSNDA